MLVTMKQILKIAQAKKYAIGAFNTPSMASLKAIISAAEERNEPVIIMHAQLHEDMGLIKMEEIAPIMLHFADKATVPVCVHLDHGEDLDYIKRGLELGFTSVMYDGSMLSGDMNYVNTSLVVEMAARYNASVEGEIGSMGERDSIDAGLDESIYTDPFEAKKFSEETGIDALSCAFGTVHGVYFREPKLDFERLKKIESLVNVPLVMHGGSGVSREDYKKLIDIGIRKVNYYTYMAKAGANAVAAMENKSYFHDMEKVASEAMKQDVLNAMSMFHGE